MQITYAILALHTKMNCHEKAFNYLSYSRAYMFDF